MTSQNLPTRLAQALALPDAHEHSSHSVYAGHMFEQARLAPLHRALVECVMFVERYGDVECECKNCFLCDAHKALASLDTAIKESGK